MAEIRRLRRADDERNANGMSGPLTLPAGGTESREVRTEQSPPRTRSDAVATSLIAGAAPIVIGAGIGVVDARLGAFVVLLAPIVLYCAVRIRLHQAIMIATPQTIVAVGFTAFYWFGLLVPRSGLAYVYSGTTNFNAVLEQSLRLAAVTAALLTAMEAAAYRPKRRHGEVSSAGDGRRLMAVSQLFMVGSLVGLTRIVSSFRGFAAARTALSSHNKLVSEQLTGTLGLWLWSICVIPAGVLIAVLLIHRRGLSINPWLARLLAAELALLLAGSVIIFGGRLVPVTILVGAAGAFYHRLRKPFRMWLIGLVAVGGILLSIQLVAARTSEEASTLSVGELVSYNVFDVSMASLTGGRGGLQSELMSPERWSTFLLSTLPGVGPSPPEVSRVRLDVLVVQQIGNSVQARTTGFPPGLPTASLLMTGSVIWGMLLAALVGAPLGAVSARLLDGPTLGASVTYAFLCTFMFETFKSGDIAASLAVYGKLAIYLGIAYAVAAILPWVRAK